MTLAAIDKYLDQHATECEDLLCELLRIPSVSADRAYQPHVQRAADWLTEFLRGFGLPAAQIPTDGHPIVYAEWLQAPGAPTILVYGHYDVQPPDPLHEWTTPPFEPTRRHGNLYARGATDDKGQMLTHLLSARAWLQTAGKLPVNLKFLIEGEEEVGSEHLEPFIAAHLPRLACDVVVISDTSMFGPTQPAITTGLRGISYHELRLTGPKQDLHSGVFGGAVTNPANALVKMLAALSDAQGRVQIPGFYDDVQELTAGERSAMQALPFDEEKFKRQLGLAALTGEAGYTTLERRWVRPTYDINGLTSGYQGEGAKTVLPARASAKFSFRLVPHQDPQKVASSLKTFLESLLPPGLTMELQNFHGAPGVVVSQDSPFVQAAVQAIEEGFGKRPVFMREGGSIPVVATFRKQLGVETLLLGWGLDDDNTHSPNEKFCLADFHRGIRSSAHLWQHLADLPRKS